MKLIPAVRNILLLILILVPHSTFAMVAEYGAPMPATATDYPDMVVIGGGLIVAGIAVLGWLWWRDRY